MPHDVIMTENDRSKYRDFFVDFKHYKSQKFMTYSITYYGLTAINYEMLPEIVNADSAAKQCTTSLLN